ncbi:ABC transporter substrate-binding protein [Brucella thiophenivorans]|uniref:Bacterial extracellular solute-binding family protein n=1 Tax=Brucella thiophenivorans TaxID=571255 RepID=A0A256FEZ8_9HYPH|nr:extracellular solute-binding protein [Brucella thiophenivorans]OYR13358.1 bacterial extracellular solute-binding family protein [Brucella thiophenivorans]
MTRFTDKSLRGFSGMVSRRSVLRGLAGGTAAAALGLHAPAVLANKRQFEGVTLQGACFQHVFHEHVKAYLPEFEEMTGMTVNIDFQAFPVYNQRMDLELSTAGNSYDFINITFPYSGRWVGAGWLHPLDDFVADPNLTEADWDADDFVSGTRAPFYSADGKTYGFPWEAGAMMAGYARFDLMEAAGFGIPETLDEFEAMNKELHGRDGLAAYVNDKLHHWNFPPYLMNFGGGVFRGAPEDLMPILDTPEAAEGAQYYADLLSKYGARGVLSFTDDQALRMQLSGQANARTNAMAWVLPLSQSPESKVKATTRYGMIPRGKAGSFPGSNANGYGIPAEAKQKEAAWAFIQWATSKPTFRKIALERGGLATPRRSIIDDVEYRKKLMINGQDVAALYLQVLEEAGEGGYMKYRTAPIFPQVGDKLNKAIERIASGQMSAVDAMKAAQSESIDDLRKAGIAL